MRNLLGNLVRETYSREKDAKTGMYYFENQKTGTKIYNKKPALLRNQRWDRDNVAFFSDNELQVLYRRCGLKKAEIELVSNLSIPKFLLPFLDFEDWTRIGIGRSVAGNKVKSLRIGVN